MLIEVKVPQLSESVAEATLLTWHKKQGDFVKRDENLVDIETDKVVLETPAPAAGVIVKIVKGDGGTVVSNEVIAQIDTEAGAATGAPAAEAKEKPQARSATAAPAAMPAAQRLAAEKRVDTTAIAGTGRGGRVTKEDVLHVIEGGAQPPARPAAPPQAPATAAAVPAPRAPAPPVDLGALGDRPEQ